MVKYIIIVFVASAIGFAVPPVASADEEFDPGSESTENFEEFDMHDSGVLSDESQVSRQAPSKADFAHTVPEPLSPPSQWTPAQQDQIKKNFIKSGETPKRVANKKSKRRIVTVKKSKKNQRAKTAKHKTKPSRSVAGAKSKNKRGKSASLAKKGTIAKRSAKKSKASARI